MDEAERLKGMRLSRARLIWILVAVGALCVVALLLGRPILREKDRQRVTQENLMTVSYALLAYQIDDEWMSYPTDLIQVFGTRRQFPINPYTGQSMREVPAGQPPTPGDFTYLHDQSPFLPGEDVCDGFVLIAYGNEPHKTFSVTDGHAGYARELLPGATSIDWDKVTAVSYSGSDLPHASIQRNEKLKREGISVTQKEVQ
jgi:hypothetical protein